MKPLEIHDARNGDHVITTGENLRQFIAARVKVLQEQYEQLLARMNNELPNKEDAVSLMVALQVADHTVNDRALMFKAFIERAAWLDKEIRALTTLGISYSKGETYRLNVEDLKRFGV